MKYKIDLQLHSNLSDGDYSISEVIIKAKKNGLKAIAITDHDVWINFSKKTKLAEKAGIHHVNGIEISTRLYGIEIHILGYSRKFNPTILKKGLKETIAGRNKRMAQVVRILKAKGIVNLDINKIKKAKGKNLAIQKYDIAKAIALKLKITNKEANKFVNEGGTAFIPYGKWAMKPTQAIKLIHQANGIAVMAHPGETLYKLKKKFNTKAVSKFTKLIEALIANGLDGIEINSPKNDKMISNLCSKYIKNNNLLVTGGSDWHGEKHHPELKMGQAGLSQKDYIKFFNRIKKDR